jgi:hypothetical protein
MSAQEQEHEAPSGLVGHEAHDRRRGDRRAYSHLSIADTPRGKDFNDFLNTHEQARIEQMLVEVQAAVAHAEIAEANAIAAGKKLMSELAAARVAAIAAVRAARIATGIVSGADES